MGQDPAKTYAYRGSSTPAGGLPPGRPSLECVLNFDYAEALFQIAIVLASATVITGAAILTWIAGGLVLIGMFFGLIGLVAPNAFHLL